MYIHSMGPTLAATDCHFVHSETCKDSLKINSKSHRHQLSLWNGRVCKKMKAHMSTSIGSRRVKDISHITVSGNLE